MIKTTITMDGLKELDEALKELPKATGKNCIRRALRAAAIPIADRAEQLIRVKKIKPSIIVTKIKFTSGDAGKQAFAAAMRAGATRGEAGEAAHQANLEASDDANTTTGVLSIGPSKRAFYGFEFGTVHLTPQPFMRPAWDAFSMQALEIIKSELAEQIEKARKRLVLKSLRILAKMNQSA